MGRDRLGQKPLLYRPEQKRIVFASELKALLALSEEDCPRKLNPRALDLYLTYGYVPHPATILEGVYKLPPGHFAVWHEGNLQLERYWNPDWNAQVERPAAEDEERLRELLTEAVTEQMVADVPLGAFLSGGIDSTIVVGLMQQASSRPVETFSIGFSDPAFDESHYAALAAKQFGTHHHAFVVEPLAWQTMPELAWQFDEPFADSSALPTWQVARETRAFVTVALTGDAGDELFGGYDRYRALALASMLDRRLSPSVTGWLGGPLARALPASARAKTRLRKAKRWLEGLGEEPAARYLRWVILCDEPTRSGLYSEEFVDLLVTSAAGDPDQADPARMLAQALGAAPKRDGVTRAMIADMLTYLPCDLLFKVDMASMAHSLECRSPFLDHRVVELALAMPLERKLSARPGQSKRVLKRAFADLLPTEIKRRSKMGFGVPIDRWFRGALKDELRAVLLDPVALSRGLFRPEAIERLIDEHILGRRDHAYRLWALLMLELWFRNHIDRTARPGRRDSPREPKGVPIGDLH
jgi:asparagine synthase (glutamine-hydrolysing)